jgi:hypothetical protein
MSWKMPRFKLSGNFIMKTAKCLAAQDQCQIECPKCRMFRPCILRIRSKILAYHTVFAECTFYSNARCSHVGKYDSQTATDIQRKQCQSLWKLKSLNKLMTKFMEVINTAEFDLQCAIYHQQA